MKKRTAVARTEVVKTRRRDIIQILQVRQLNHLAERQGLQLCASTRAETAPRGIAFFAWDGSAINVAMVPSACQPCQAPSDDKNNDSKRKDFRARTEGTRRDDVDEQLEHAEELQQTACVEDGLLHQILSKFFSIS